MKSRVSTIFVPQMYKEPVERYLAQKEAYLIEKLKSKYEETVANAKQAADFQRGQATKRILKIMLYSMWADEKIGFGPVRLERVTKAVGKYMNLLQNDYGVEDFEEKIDMDFQRIGFDFDSVYGGCCDAT
ncbi:MAG: hypothetical protein UGF45_13270 [Massilioclostridium sp.]|nr:hypothetical protein [Massilioclostridium sp.]MEE1492936.1 hypothetical protein [Massilioclostridium sp.]